MPSVHARLLAQSLLAVIIGTSACDDGDAPNVGAQADPQQTGGLAGGAAGQAGGGVGGGAGAGRELDLACSDGVPQIVDGAQTGMLVCADGTLARVAATHCRLADLANDPQCPLGGVPRTDQLGGGQQCDKDCDAGPYGRPRFGQFEPRCAYFCTTDADCPGGTACACAESGVGQCVGGPCRTATDCGDGSSCRLTDRTEHCDFMGFRWLECVGPEDACVTDDDCAPGGRGAREDADPGDAYCRALDGKGVKSCGRGGFVCGRPIFAAGGALLALLRRGDSAWSGEPEGRSSVRRAPRAARWLSGGRALRALARGALLATLSASAGCDSDNGGRDPRVADCASTPIFSCVLQSRDSSTCREVFSPEAAEGLRAQCKEIYGQMRDGPCDTRFDVCCQDDGAPEGYPQRACLYSIRDDVYESFRASCGGEICK